MALKHQDSPAQWLRAELETRVLRNPRFSQRAFSRLLGISPGRLSEILRGKRAVGPQLAQRVEARLAMKEGQRRVWQALVARDRSTRSRLRQLARVDAGAGDTRYFRLQEDLLAFVKSWRHLALLNLLKTSDCRSSASWMARRLNIGVAELTELLTRLEKLGLVVREGGRWSRTKARLTTPNDIPLEALREAHRGELHLIEEKMESVPVELRDISSIYMAIPSDRIAEAKKLIASFRRSFCDTLESSGPADEVYLLNINFVPLTDRGER